MIRAEAWFETLAESKPGVFRDISSHAGGMMAVYFPPTSRRHAILFACTLREMTAAQICRKISGGLEEAGSQSLSDGDSPEEMRSLSEAMRSWLRSQRGW
ncbi:MAG: hypothetical protein ABJF10_25425 [Chthoniobacter sp.]